MAFCRSSLSKIDIALTRRFSARSLISFSISSLTWYRTISRLATPTSAIIFSWNSHSLTMAWWPNIKASSISSSLTSAAPDSTMLMASLVPATERWMSDFSLSSVFGLMMNLPSTRPTWTPAIGPSNGMLLIDKASDEPSIADISGVLSKSTLKTVLTTWTSLRKPSANIGRIGRSIKRAVNVACSLGRPSLLKKEPGILPTAYCFSS